MTRELKSKCRQFPPV